MKRKYQCILDRALMFLLLGVLYYVAWRVYSLCQIGMVTRMLAAVAMSTVAFCIFGLMLYSAHRIFRKTKWRIAGCGLLFIWGGVVCLCAEFHTKTSIVCYVAMLVVFAVAVMFSLFGRAAFNWLRIITTPDSVKTVFWGMSDRDILLARSLVKSSDATVVQFNLPIDKFYDPVARARLTDLADEIDALWIFMDFEHLGKRAHGGSRHFFLDNEGHFNLALADKLIERIMEDASICSEVALYVRVGDIDQDEIFAEWARNAYEGTGHLVRPVILHEPEMIARQFVQRFPPLSYLQREGLIDTDSATVKGVGCRTLLIGLDHTGRALLSAFLCQSRYIGQDGKSIVALPVTVVDMREDRWHRYCLACPEIADQQNKYSVDFKCLQVGYDAFEQWFRERHADFDRIVICLNGDTINIREAMRMQNILIELCDTRKEIIARVSNPSVSECVSRRSDSAVTIQYFGNLQEIYSKQFIFDDLAECMARAINWQWNFNRDLDSGDPPQCLSRSYVKEQQDDIMRLWESASYSNRLSSRASALGAISFMRLIGVECDTSERDSDEWCEISSETVKARIRKSRDVLARVEHLRWCTYLCVRGMRKWDLETPKSLEAVVKELSVPVKVPNSLANQTKAFRAHAALVGFDELPILDMRLAKAVDTQLCDRLSVESFIGESRPDVGGGWHAASMQCKDYDCWNVIADAAVDAGIKFFVPGPRERKQNVTVQGRHVFVRIKEVLMRFRDWLMRGSSDYNKRDYNQVVSLARWKEMKSYAQWTQGAYRDECDLPGDDLEAFGAYGDFLGSSIVEYASPNMKWKGRTFRVFWFDDLVSPHRLSMTNECVNSRSRYAYVYDFANGVIKPLSRMSLSFRRECKKIAGISGRRVNFSRQPDFCAQVMKTSNKIVVIFRGTVTVKDWCENVLQCLGRIPPQFRMAADLVRAICETTSLDILLLGHSEGGGEVQYSLMKNSKQRWTSKRNINGITFNSQRLSPRIMDYLLEFGADQDYACDHIDNFRTGADVVSGWAALGLDLLGSVYQIGDNAGFWRLNAHRIGYFCRQLEKTPPHKKSISA